jgi:hypothetical protein
MTPPNHSTDTFEQDIYDRLLVDYAPERLRDIARYLAKGKRRVLAALDNPDFPDGPDFADGCRRDLDQIDQDPMGVYVDELREYDAQMAYLDARACRKGRCHHDDCERYRVELHAELYPGCPDHPNEEARLAGHGNPTTEESVRTRAYAARHGLTREEAEAQADEWARLFAAAEAATPPAPEARERPIALHAAMHPDCPDDVNDCWTEDR